MKKGVRFGSHSPKSLLSHPRPLWYRCSPISHQCKRLCARLVRNTFAPSPKHWWANFVPHKTRTTVWKPLCREEKQTQNVWSGFPNDIPDPYARMPWGLKVSPHRRSCRKTHFLVRTSTIFSVDVHDPKGFEKLCTKKVCAVFAPGC